MSYTIPFLRAIKMRRSILFLGKESPISDNRIVMMVNHAIKHAPSPFHVQSCRAIVVFGEDHEKLWDMAYEVTKKSVPPTVFATLEPKIRGFRDAYGTVMFFEDSAAYKTLPPHLQNLMEKYPEWYEHSSGMNQFIVWTALVTEGLGCNLQHYQPGISEGVADTWNVPETWSLRAQLVFGTPMGAPRGGVDKVFAPLEERVKVYGAKR